MMGKNGFLPDFKGFVESSASDARCHRCGNRFSAVTLIAALF